MGIWKRLLTFLLPIIIAYNVFWCDKFNPESIRGKRVLVTGASTGIGESIAHRYAELGAKLVITARREDLLLAVAKKCKELGAQEVYSVPADMGSTNYRKKIVDATEKHLGGLDFLILNHAVIVDSVWNGTPVDLKKLDEMMNINFVSFVDITSGLLKLLKQSKGHICVVSSMAGKLGINTMASYAASKHALQGFFSSLRQELRISNTDVSVTLAVYGPVASQHIIELSKTTRNMKDVLNYAGTTKDAAEALVTSVSLRFYEFYFPRMSTVISVLYRIFPDFIEDYFSSYFKE